MSGRNLLSIRDLSDAGMLALFDLAAEFAADGRRRLPLAHDALLATLFYEPSTRTRMSFEAAMLRLGGQVISMADPAASSAAKGETLADTIRIVDGYADAIVLRHPCEGAAHVAAHYSRVPVINAGDGAREHPTQTLVDLFTILREKGQLTGLTVALCGDLRYGRTVHSLVQALARFGVRLIGIAPPGLELPAGVAHHGGRPPIRLENYPTIADAPLDECDVVYVTRIQKERFSDPAAYAQVRSSYVISPASLARLHPEAIILHPLPRVDELDYALDGDPRAAYFRQAAYGVPVRMALLAVCLGLRTLPALFAAPAPAEELAFAGPCPNLRCVTGQERGLPFRLQRSGDGHRCVYCDAEVVPCPAC
jgi:aspartate carbamoyltransferase catalytic subunit